MKTTYLISAKQPNGYWTIVGSAGHTAKAKRIQKRFQKAGFEAIVEILKQF